MIASPDSKSVPQVSRTRVLGFAAIAFCGVLPAIAIGVVFSAAVQDDTVATDFRQYYDAAVAMLDGDTIYPDGRPHAIWGGPYPYPPLPAQVAIPFTALSFETAGVVVMALLLACATGTLYALGVRDWRCYGIAFMWPPVVNAVQSGNVTLVLGLGAALVWRYRERSARSALPLAPMLAVKFFVWPLLVWLAATQRRLTMAIAGAGGASLLVASWAVIGFDGITEYPERLRKLESHFGSDSYTAYIVGLDIGLPSPAARLLWLGVGLGLLGALIAVGRRGDERSAFVLAIAASLALTPIVWLHYFALLLLVVSLVQPRLGLLWFVPLAMVVTPGSGQPTPFETAATLAIAAVTIGAALRMSTGANARIRRSELRRVSPQTQ